MSKLKDSNHKFNFKMEENYRKLPIQINSNKQMLKKLHRKPKKKSMDKLKKF